MMAKHYRPTQYRKVAKSNVTHSNIIYLGVRFLLTSLQSENVTGRLFPKKKLIFMQTLSFCIQKVHGLVFS